jgi:hypothetical protein
LLGVHGDVANGAGHVSQAAAGAEEAMLPPAGDAVFLTPASPQADRLHSQRQAAADGAAAAAAGWLGDSVRSIQDAAVATRRSSSPAAGDRPRLGHLPSDCDDRQQQHLPCARGASWDADADEAAAGCAAADRALGHAGDGPCRCDACDDPMCVAEAQQCGNGCGATSIDGSGLAAQDSCGRVVGGDRNRLVRQHSSRVGVSNAGDASVAAGAAGVQCAAADATGAAISSHSRKRELDVELPGCSSMGAADALGSCNAAAAAAAAKRQKLEEDPAAAAAAAAAGDCGMTDAAEAAAMPVPECEMPSAADLLERQMSAAVASLAACEAAAQPVTEQQLVHASSGGAEAAAAAAAAAVLSSQVKAAEPTAAVRKRSSADGQGGDAVVGCSKHAKVALETAILPQLPAAAAAAVSAAAAAQVAPTSAQLAAAALRLPVGIEGGAVGSHAIAARLVQAALATPGGGVAAAAALQQWTAAQQQAQQVQQHDAAAVAPVPVPALRPQLQPPPQQQQQQAALWGPAMGFRTWGPGRPPGAVLTPPSLPLPLQLPLPMELLAAASLGGGVPGSAAGPHAAAALLPGFAGAAGAAAAVNAGLPPLAGAAAAAGVAQPVGAAAGPLSCLPAWALMGPPGPLAAATAVACLPLGVAVDARPASCSPAPGMQQLLGGQLMPVALPGACWPLAAAVGKWPVPPVRPPRQRRRGQAVAESEQTDSCHK